LMLEQHFAVCQLLGSGRRSRHPPIAGGEHCGQNCKRDEPASSASHIDSPEEKECLQHYTEIRPPLANVGK
jgi:hypothetical protein